MSELAEAIAEQIVEFVQHVRATCRLTDGIYRSPTGPYGLRRQWLGVEWLGDVLEKLVRTGGYIPFRQNFPKWGVCSPWPRGRDELPGEPWCHREFMPHLTRGAATGNPDGPAATGLIAPMGTVPTTAEGQRRLGILMSLATCPIRDNGVSVVELERLEAVARDLRDDLATVGDKLPVDLIGHEEAAGIVGCSAKTIGRRIEGGELCGYGEKRLVSEAEVESKKQTLLKRRSRTSGSKR